MREIGSFEAKNTLGALLDLVEHGEEVVITRYGKPVARLVKETGRVDRDQARQAGARIRELARSTKLGRFDWRNGRPTGTRGVREPCAGQLGDAGMAARR